MAAPGGTVTLILGVGNLLLGDDGVGVHVAQRLRPADPAVRVVDGGTLGLELHAQLRGLDTLIIVDAVDHGARPGAITRLAGAEALRVFARPLSVHQVGVEALLGALALSGHAPPRVTVIGIQPGSLEPGTELTPAVARALPDVVRILEQEAGTRLAT